MRLSFVFCHGSAATEEKMVILRATSSSSKSVMVLPSSTLRCRSVAPAVKSIAEASDVFPLCPCPIKATFRISDVSKTFMMNLQRRIRASQLGLRSFKRLSLHLKPRAYQKRNGVVSELKHLGSGLIGDVFPCDAEWGAKGKLGEG